MSKKSVSDNQKNLMIELIINVIPPGDKIYNDSKMKSITLVDEETKKIISNIIGVEYKNKNELSKYLMNKPEGELKDIKKSIFELFKPRQLTDEEIDFIVSGLFEPPGATKEAREMAREQIIKSLRYRLERIELTPVGILDMIDKINHKYMKSLVEPASAVGILCSEAISAPITQLTLNTFHQSGSSKNISSGLEALRELFNVTENRKNYNMNIQFNNKKLTYDDIFLYRERTVELKMSDIMIDYEVIDTKTEDLAPWTSLYLMMTEQTLPKTEWFLRIKLDVNMLYTYKISMDTIIRKISDKTTPPTIIMIPSPINIGIIDCYPDEETISSSTFLMKEYKSKSASVSASEKATFTIIKDSDQMKKQSDKDKEKKDNESKRSKGKEVRFDVQPSLLFLNIIFTNVLESIKITGISGIKSVFPAYMPIYSIVLEEIYMEGNTWYLALSKMQMIKTGIKLDNLKDLLNFIEVKILDEGLDGIFVEMPDKFTGRKIAPSKYITDLVSAEEKKSDDIENKKKQEGIKGFINPPSEIESLSKYWYAETNGKNFYDIIEDPNVDPLTTYTNDFHETARILGIEAARNLLFMEFRMIITSEEYVNSRHISLLVELMTNIGKITSLNFIGAKKQQRGALTLSTFEQSMKTFESAAAFGKEEEIDTVSTAIMTGKRFGVGTGFVTIDTDPKYKEYIQKSRSNPNPDKLTEDIEFDYKDILNNFELIGDGEEPDIPDEYEPTFKQKSQVYVDENFKFPTEEGIIVNPSAKIENVKNVQYSPPSIVSTSLEDAISNVINDIPIIAEHKLVTEVAPTEIVDAFDKRKNIEPGTVEKITVTPKIKPPPIRSIKPKVIDETPIRPGKEEEEVEVEIIRKPVPPPIRAIKPKEAEQKVTQDKKEEASAARSSLLSKLSKFNIEKKKITTAPAEIKKYDIGQLMQDRIKLP